MIVKSTATWLLICIPSNQRDTCCLYGTLFSHMSLAIIILVNSIYLTGMYLPESPSRHIRLQSETTMLLLFYAPLDLTSYWGRDWYERELQYSGPNSVIRTPSIFCSMADGKTNFFWPQDLLNGRIVVGCGVYAMSCLVVYQLAIDCLIGFARQLTYDARMKPQRP